MKRLTVFLIAALLMILTAGSAIAEIMPGGPTSGDTPIMIGGGMTQTSVPTATQQPQSDNSHESAESLPTPTATNAPTDAPTDAPVTETPVSTAVPTDVPVSATALPTAEPAAAVQSGGMPAWGVVLIAIGAAGVAAGIVFLLMRKK